jgi:hypothetical protein
MRIMANARLDWIINGHDYGHNFTVNICEPVLADYSDVVGVTDRTNVSGFYLDGHGNKISIGYKGGLRTLTLDDRADFLSFAVVDYC